MPVLASAYHGTVGMIPRRWGRRSTAALACTSACITATSPTSATVHSGVRSSTSGRSTGALACSSAFMAVEGAAGCRCPRMGINWSPNWFGCSSGSPRFFSLDQRPHAANVAPLHGSSTKRNSRSLARVVVDRHTLDPSAACGCTGLTPLCAHHQAALTCTTTTTYIGVLPEALTCGPERVVFGVWWTTSFHSAASTAQPARQAARAAQLPTWSFSAATNSSAERR